MRQGHIDVPKATAVRVDRVGRVLSSEDEDSASRGFHEAWGLIGEKEGEPVRREERDGEENRVVARKGVKGDR